MFTHMEYPPSTRQMCICRCAILPCTRTQACQPDILHLPRHSYVVSPWEVLGSFFLGKPRKQEVLDFGTLPPPPRNRFPLLCAGTEIVDLQRFRV